MRSKRILLFALLVTVTLNSAQPVAAQVQFPMISIPSVYADADSRAEYLVTHYWERFDFKNSILVGSSVAEQGFVDFVSVLPLTDYATACRGIKSMLDKAKTDAATYERFVELGDKYLYDPNSPVRNDEYYIPVAEHALACPLIDNDMKIRYRSQLSFAKLNRPGHKATDFTYTLATGKQGRMWNINADYTLLFFYNPGCPNCAQIKQLLRTSQVVESMHRAGRLTVLAVYPDADLTEWRNGLSDNPSWWISSYDKGTVITERELYDLKAIPTLYLLDSQKIVLLKDPQPEAVIGYLEQL